MTVKELVEQLQKLPQHKEVVVTMKWDGTYRSDGIAKIEEHRTFVRLK